jgi:hypothetical protein
MLAELAEVSPEEYGFLTILRDLMFVRGGAIADDPRVAKRYLGFNEPRWLRLRESLIERGKIYQNGNTLRSQLVDETLENTRESRRKATGKLPESSANPMKSHDRGPSSTIQNNRYEESKKNEAAPPSSFGNDVVAAQEGRRGLGEQSEPVQILISDTLARQIQSRSKWHQ